MQLGRVGGKRRYTEPTLVDMSDVLKSVMYRMEQVASTGATATARYSAGAVRAPPLARGDR